MLEIPSLATAVAALALLAVIPRSRFPLNSLLAGLVFGLAIGMKLVPVILGPVALLLLLSQTARPGKRLPELLQTLLAFSLSAIASFVIMDLVIEHGAYLMHFRQSWASHFGAAKSFEYGSAADHPFDWGILLRNWDLTVPALLGMASLVHRARTNPAALLPVVWLGLMYLVFAFHRPWWSYYYVHIAVPLCWCAAIGYVQGAKWLAGCRANPSGKSSLPWRVWVSATALAVLFALAALAWSASRVSLQVMDIRESPKTTSAPIVAELRRYRTEVETLFTDAGVYSFHSGIPLPPDLAVVPLKRFWSGEMTLARLTEELKQARPGLVLLPNDSREIPYQDWLLSQYRLIYQDHSHLLYAAHNGLPKAN